MNTIDRKPEYIDLLRARLKEKRFQHSLNVADAAVHLAEQYGADVQKAYVAGLLHDVTKNDSHENQLQIMKSNGIILSSVEANNPKLWHAMSGACFLKSELGLADEDVLNAVRYHTTGRAGMSLLEKVIYIADYISVERDYPDADVMRRLSKVSLEDAAMYSLQYTLQSLSQKKKPIHPDSLAFYNELVILSMKGLK